MATRQERAAARRARVAKQADTIIEQATERVVAARPSPAPAQASGEADPQEVKRLRDGGMAWWVIGQTLGLVGPATSASEPEAKRGAGRARALYAAANRGEVPRTHKPRAGAVAKPTGPGRGGTVTSRKEQLVNEGHVIPRDMPDDEVEQLIRGRTIEWAIDMARLTNTAPEAWGGEDGRWCKQDARVHPEEQWVYCGEEDKLGNRVVRFREYLGRDQHGRLMAGPTRTVRVDAIYTIR